MAKVYPELTFIVSQSGTVQLLDSMIRVAKQHPNICIELVLNVNILGTKRIVAEIEPQRVMMGTDAPWGSYSLGRKMVEEIAEPEKQGLILGGSIQKILSLT